MTSRRARDGDEPATEPIPCVPPRPSGRRSTRRPGLIAVALVVAVGVAAVVLAMAAQRLPARLAAGERAAPFTVSATPTPVPTSPLADEPARSPCSDAASFRQALEATSPGFTDRRGIDRYELVGCEEGTALAQGIVPEQDSLFVGLTPRGEGYTVDTWAPGTECGEVDDLPRSLATAFCATIEPTSTTTSATAGDCAAGTTTCPPGYQEGVTSAANPYGCDFDAISAENPCMWRYDDQEPGGPGIPTPVTAAQRWAVCHLSGYDQFC